MFTNHDEQGYHDVLSYFVHDYKIDFFSHTCMMIEVLNIYL